MNPATYKWFVRKPYRKHATAKTAILLGQVSRSHKKGKKDLPRLSTMCLASACHTKQVSRGDVSAECYVGIYL